MSDTENDRSFKENEWRVVDERTSDVPSYNIFKHVNSKLGRQHTKALLAGRSQSIILWAYCTHSARFEWCSVWRFTTTPGSTSPTLFLQWCWFFYAPQEPDKCKCCETVFRPYPRRLESLTVCRCHYKGSTFLPLMSKTLSVGPAGVRTRDLPLSRPALSQLSQPGGGLLVVHRYPSKKSIKK